MRLLGLLSFGGSTAVAASIWRTEPTFAAQKFDIKYIAEDRSLLADGYVFISPSTFLKGWGPKIYTIDGDLIWDGGIEAQHIVQQFHACNDTTNGPQNLCWHEAGALAKERKAQNESDATDFHRIFDGTYTEIGQPLWTTGNLTALDLGHKVVPAQPDAHEFTVVGNGSSYVQVTYSRMPKDLGEWHGPEEGFIMENCFQEVRFRPSEVIYEWCYNDHLHMESHVLPSGPEQTEFSTTMGGDGSWFGAWDFYHLNSVDKNEEGDYLLSGRHADQVMKIAGPGSPNGAAGTVLWRLGGVSNQFEKANNFIFTRQHDARFVSTSADETTFSIFDNAWEGEQELSETSQPYSSAKLISINNATMQARVIQEYAHPDGSMCRSGGSARMLPNGNMWVGWGFIREVSEFAADGTLLYHAAMTQENGNFSASYRDFKSEWHATPASSPKLLAYIQHCAASSEAPLMAYVSWNGATEVAAWRFYFSNDQDGPWILASTVNRKSFETSAILGHEFVAWVRAEALDANEQILGNQSVRTFVPTQEALSGCDMYGCDDERFTSYADTFDVGGLCTSRHAPVIASLEANLTSEKAATKDTGNQLWPDPKDAFATYIASSTLTNDERMKSRPGAAFDGAVGGNLAVTPQTCEYLICRRPAFIFFIGISLAVTLGIVRRWHSQRKQSRFAKR